MPSLLLDVVVLTVALSVVLHGLSSTPLSNWLSARIEARGEEEIPEIGGAYKHPTRTVNPPSPD